ncbi:MAG: DEAD/DEAH box helicase [Myxococcota bacterium]|nr:DEAD/DEAH box helicase [Myxococcota bacterium]
MSNEHDNPETIRFADMALSAPLLRALSELGFELPTPIQALAIPHLIEGRDIIGQAQTGTGKTAAFGLPLLDKIEVDKAVPQLLVVAPTRELALQVCEAIKGYAKHLKGLRVLPVYGGQGMTTQLRSLRRGVHCVVGTPGRLLDHLERETLNLDAVNALVLDEADEMLRMGFVEEVEKIMEQLPDVHQTALFSATMPKPIARIAKRFLTNPVEVRTKSKETTVEAIKQYYIPVTGELKKLEALSRLVETEDFDGMIVFTRTRVATVELSDQLEARGYKAQALNGDMSQQVRQRTVDRFKAADFDILICTDVAARGLDVPRISHVINYDIPFDTEVYVHRIGRTGRAGRDGKAILFAGKRQKRMLSTIERATKKKIERLALPSADDVREHRIAHFKGFLSTALGEHNLDGFRTIVSDYCKETDHDPISVAAALVHAYQLDRPFAVKNVQIEDVERPKKGAKHKTEPAPARAKRTKTPKSPMDVYRVEVGSEDGLEPKHLVGALTNEIDLPSSYIGSIRVGTKHTVVELPAGMPPDVLSFLKNVRVCGKRLNMSHLGGERMPKTASRRRTRDGSGSRSKGPRRKQTKSTPRKT